MPTYDYRCPIGHTHERFEAISAPSAAAGVACPTCGETARRSVGGGCGVHFKGDGFYETDYKKRQRGERGRERGERGERGECAS